jgi:hypothetical protein
MANVYWSLVFKAIAEISLFVSNSEIKDSVIISYNLIVPFDPEVII